MVHCGLDLESDGLLPQKEVRNPVRNLGSFFMASNLICGQNLLHSPSIFVDLIESLRDYHTVAMLTNKFT